MDREFFMKARVLFVIDGCDHCRIWKTFIEKFNMNLPINKRIIMLDCSRYHDFGIIEHPLIRAYRKHLGSYPTLFFEGQKVEGTNTSIELLAFMRSYCKDDVLLPDRLYTILDGKFIPFNFERECEHKRTWLGKRVVCQ